MLSINGRNSAEISSKRAGEMSPQDSWWRAPSRSAWAARALSRADGGSGSSDSRLGTAEGEGVGERL